MTAETKTASASSFYDEAANWRELPFVLVKDKKVVSNWAPPDFPEEVDVRDYTTQCILGTRYAMDLIDHLISYGEDKLDGGAISDVAKAMIERGKWTGVEIGFFDALGVYVARGFVSAAVGFNARHSGPGEVSS